MGARSSCWCAGGRNSRGDRRQDVDIADRTMSAPPMAGRHDLCAQGRTYHPASAC
jgi:hypothetical protein